MPLYSVALYKESIDEIQKFIEKEGLNMSLRDFFIGKHMGLVQRCLKTINSKLPQIMSKKGCDASNAFDEEIGSDQEYFSDDEAEKAAKQAKK